MVQTAVVIEPVFIGLPYNALAKRICGTETRAHAEAIFNRDLLVLKKYTCC